MVQWTKKNPVHEGLFAWRSRSNRNDPFTWQFYYVVPPDHDSIGKDKVEYWENGTAVEPPTGGWWSEKPLLTEKGICPH